MRKTHKKFVIIPVALLAAIGFAAACLFYFGVLHFNNPDDNTYPIKGVDVSSYQGEIDWGELSSNNIDFAFIKATEGSSFTDPRFEKNYNAAQKTGLRIGAYHFFSFESSGKTQAENFCSIVSPCEKMLPPVVDVEYYGDYKNSSEISVDKIQKELHEYISYVSEYYGMMPIIYATAESYGDVIAGEFDGCDIWIRSVYGSPSSDINWKFWQYSNRHILSGYKGKEKYIDMNVFVGSAEEFSEYAKQ